MNRIYKSIWNEQTGTYVAVSENVKAKGKRSGSSVLASAILAVTVGAYAQAQTVKVGDEEPVNGNRIVFSSDTGTIDGLSGTFDIADVNNANLAVTAGQLNTVNQAVIKNADDISALNGRVTTAEGEIDVLQTGLGTANTNISGLTTRVTTAEGKIDDLDTGLSTTNSNISGLTARVGETETDITTLQTTLSDLGVSDTFSGIKYFRVNSDKDDASATGVDSVAIGPQAVSSGLNSVALGFMTQAQAENAFAAGVGAVVTAEGGSAIALGDGAIAGGNAPGSGGTAAVAIGRNSVASGSSTVALGDDAKASGSSATALGAKANAAGANSIALGGAQANAEGSFAAGFGASTGVKNSISLGTGAGAGVNAGDADDREGLIAIGTKAGQNVGGSQNIAIGAGSGSDVSGYFNVALGQNSGTNLGVGSDSVVSIGREANHNVVTTLEHAVAIGSYTKSATDSVAIGHSAKSAKSGVAIGYDANAAESAVALGTNAKATSGSVALGLNSAASALDWAGSSYLTNQATPGSVVSVGNRNEGGGDATLRRIVNVADGAATSDAATVGQLHKVQTEVAGLIGGGVSVNAEGSFSDFTVKDKAGNSHTFGSVAEGFALLANGTIQLLPATAVTFVSDTDKRIAGVAAGINNEDVVNVGQLKQALTENKIQYFHVNSSIDANKGSNGAAGTNAMAIGPNASAGGDSSIAFGHDASTSATQSIAIGNDVDAIGIKSTVIGNSGTMATHEGGVAIGENAHSYGENSIVIGTGARSHLEDSVVPNHNTVVIGTSAEVTADNGTAIGMDAVATDERAVALGTTAQARGEDSLAFGSNAVATGVSSQASGTGANASGLNAQASGTGASASGFNAVATGTGAVGYATDGIAMGTGAVSGFSDPYNQDTARNTAGIAIGKASLADEEHALALGVEAKARAKFATAIGDGAEATVAAVNGLAVGTGARVSAESAAAFGSGAGATALNATALGQGAQATHQGSVALGSGSFTAAAVNTPNLSIDKETYNFAGTNATSTVSVGGDGVVRTITNVAAGRVAANSTDAINGSQLHGTNMALEALADDLDTAGQSVADALGSGFGYDADKHQVTGSFTLNGNAGNNFTTIQQGLEHVAKGWNVGANGQTAANVAPGGSVDFSTSDGDIVIARNGTNLTFGLSDDIEIGNSITVGGPGNQTVINQGNVTTNNLTATGETRLGDKFVVKNDGTVTYNNTEIANKNDGLSFAGNTGGNIAKKLGDTTPLTISGALAGSEAVTGANLRVDSDGNKLNLVMARNLTDLDSIAINNGPVINNQGINMGGKRITGLAPGIDGTDAVNVDQLEAVETIANKGWDISANGSAGANVAPGGSVDFSNTDGNLVITRDGTDLTFNLANELTVGDTIIKGDSITTNNLTVDGRTQLGDNFIVNEDNSVTYKSAELANLNDGLSFMGDDSNIVTRKLNETLGLTGGADTGNLSENNLGVVQKDDGSLSIQLAKDLAGLNSATFKDDANTTVINSSGLTITDGPSVTVGGIDGGNKQITGVASGLGGINLADATGDTLTNAANIGDLQKATNNLTTAGLNFAGNTGDEIHKDLGEILNIVGGLDAAKDASDANIRVDSENGELRIKLATSLTDLENIQVGKDGVDGIDGTIGVNGKDGASVVLNGKDGSIGLTGPAGANGEPGASANISVKDGAPGLDGNDGVNGESKTRIVYEKPDGMTEEVATLNDGLKFVGDDGNTVSRKLNETLGLTGGAAAADLTGEGNIGVIQKDDGSLSIQLAKDIDLTEDGSLTVGDTVVSDTGLVVQDVTANPTATTKVEAGKIELFANPTGSPANTIAIDASTGDITGLTNRDLVADDFATAGRAATEEQLAIVNETANKGWNVSTNADTASSENVAPGETVDFDNTDGNIVIGQTGTNLTFDLAKNIKVDSINAGGTLINSNGLSFVDTNGAQLPNTVFIKPDGIDMGGRKITSLSKGEISATSTDAVNGSQLSFLADSVKNIFGGDVSFNFENGTFTSPTYTINGEDYSTVQAAIDKLAEGWKVTVSDPSGSNPGTGGTPGTGGGTSGTGTGGSSGTGTGGPADILPGDQLTLVGGDNIDIVQKPKDKGNVDIEISVDPNLVVDSVTTGKTVMDDSGVKVGENVKLGDTGLTIVGGPTGDLAFTADKVDVGGNKITSVANGTIAADSKDAVNGGQIHNIGESVANAFGGGSKVNPDGTVSAPSYTVGNNNTVVNNVGDAIEVLNQGWTLNAGGNDSQVQSGDKVSLLNTDGNIVITQVLGSAEVNFNLNDKITVTEVNATTVNATTVNATTFQAGNTIVNNGGLSFVNKAGEQVGPSVSSSGINAGGSTITNVAAGVNDTDAVNVGQLKGVANNLNNQINAVRGDLKRVDRDARAGTASAAAMANLPQAYLPGKSVFAISTAGHRGEQGYAAGLSTITDNGKWILKGSVSGNSRGDVTYGAGVGYQW